jgi:hypothetical protein
MAHGFKPRSFTLQACLRKCSFYSLKTSNRVYDFVGQSLLGDLEYLEAGRAVNNYPVSLVEGNDLIGSATLISIGKASGLLTADHVWQRILKGEVKGHFCMVFGAEIQRFEYPFEECTPIVVGHYSPDHAEEGPDLVFIHLHNLLKLGTIMSRKSIYPLVPEYGKVFDQIPCDRYKWLVWGTPAEASSLSSTQAGEPLLKIVQFTGGADFLEKIERDGFDYVKLQIPSGNNNFPNQYGGVSGGGVWIPIRTSEDPEGKILKPMVSLLFAGVAYFQIDAEGNFKTLIIHGPKSIYERLVQEVNRQLPPGIR